MSSLIIALTFAVVTVLSAAAFGRVLRRSADVH
jgi:hypothetical protein